MNNIKTALLALVGVAILGTSVQAQSFSNGDLILAFRLNNSGGAGTNLEVDLGSAATFNFASNQSSIAAFNVADLTATYGSSWNTNANLVFSIVAASGTPSNNKPLYLSNPGNANTPLTFTTTNTAYSNVSGIYSVSGGTLQSGGGYQIAESNTQSYYNILTNGGAYSQDYNFVPYSTEQAVSTTSASLDLYREKNGNSSTDLGTFSLSGAGVLSFTAPVAVPEPASYVLGGIAGVLFLIMRRRSKIQA